ncbi:MAG: sulfite exporter TauE/SafE family protein [Planctomycetota bacterium]
MEALTLFGAVVVASLLGSLHCAGMCGPLVAFVVGPPAAEGGRGAGQVRLQAAYHLSRGFGYVALGLAAGAAGRLADVAGVLAGLQPLAAALAGATLAAAGLVMLLGHFGRRIPEIGLPGPLARALRGLQQRAFRLPPTARAFAIGATTTLLPCGWLYAFAVAAAGTGQPALGALVMAAFWLGTFPVLSALGAGVRRLSGALGARLRPVASLVLIAAGVVTLSGRVGLDSLAIAQSVESRDAAAASLPEASEPMPCCSGEDDSEAASDAVFKNGRSDDDAASAD